MTMRHLSEAQQGVQSEGSTLASIAGMRAGWISKSLLVALAGGMASIANAGITYGDFDEVPPGIVIYTGVTESSGTNSLPPGLYSAPEIRGNQLDFDPQGFISTSSGGPLDITDGQLNFGLTAIDGFGIQEIVIQEAGDYSFAGSGVLGTTVMAGVSIWVEVLEIDNEPVERPIFVNASNSFSTNMEDAGGPTTLAPWTLDLAVDLTQAAGAGAILGVTKAKVVIDNQLITNSEMESLAFIAKKDFKVTPIAVFIPEPASLLMLALAGFALRRR